MEKPSPPRVNVHSDWYRTYENDKEMVERLKFWEGQINDDEEKLMLTMYQMWKGYTEEEKAELRHRTILLMRIVILRAHGYVASDFKQFKNPFAGRYRVRFTST